MKNNIDEANRWLNAGVLHARSGETEEALKCFEKAIAYDQAYDIAWFNKGTTLSKLNKLKEAEHCFLKAIDINSEDPDYYINLGLIYEKSREYEKGIDAYKKALQFDCKDNLGTLYFNVAVCLRKSGNNIQALHYYDRALEINRLDYQALTDSIVCLMRIREFEQAADRLNVLDKMAPDSPQTKQLGTLVKSILSIEDPTERERALALMDIIVMDERELMDIMRKGK